MAGTSEKVEKFISGKLSSVLTKEKYSEVHRICTEAKQSQEAAKVYFAFGKIIRVTGKGNLDYSDSELQEADSIRANWVPPPSLDRAARLLLLLQIDSSDEASYLSILETLFSSGDVSELVSLYGALSVLPLPEKLITRCAEGSRTNMGEVFEAVANNNPFPADYISEEAFNQMVLKCLFVGKPLYKVVNLNKRLNKHLSVMALDYAHERWAASRKVNPELWQLVVPYLQEENIKDIQRLAGSDDEFEKQAAALVCSQSQITNAKEISVLSNYKQKVESGELNWHNLSEAVWINSI